jgi:hypothetical protein
MQIHRIPDWVPGIGAWAGLGYFGHLWVKEGQEGAIPHEMVHVEQQRRDGYLRFLWRYVTSAPWRAEYEAEAYAADVRLGRMTLARAATHLSSGLYLRAISYEGALVLIQRHLE